MITLELRRGFAIWFSSLFAATALGGLGMFSTSTIRSSSNMRILPNGEPKLVVDETERDLGLVDPSEEVGHEFVVRNEGVAPLTLARGQTSCKCTVSELAETPIPPGGHAVVRIASKTKQLEGRFSQRAEILTNDPRHPMIALKISGTVRTYLAIHPSTIVLNDVKRVRGRTASVKVFSQVWRRFAIENVETSLDGLTWDISDISERTLDEMDAVAGYKLTMTLPAKMPVGSFSHPVRLTVLHDGEEASSDSLEFLIAGNVLGRATVTGSRLDSRKVVHMGALSAGEGARERLILRFHDPPGDVAIERIETVPDFLSVRIAPRTQASARLGLYWLDVQVPPDAPAGSFMGDRRGEIRIFTDHPELPVLKLGIEFAVVSS